MNRLEPEHKRMSEVEITNSDHGDSIVTAIDRPQRPKQRPRQRPKPLLMMMTTATMMNRLEPEHKRMSEVEKSFGIQTNSDHSDSIKFYRDNN